jgi:hypothetical protein
MVGIYYYSQESLLLPDFFFLHKPPSPMGKAVSLLSSHVSTFLYHHRRNLIIGDFRLRVACIEG